MEPSSDAATSGEVRLGVNSMLVWMGAAAVGALVLVGVGATALLGQDSATTTPPVTPARRAAPTTSLPAPSTTPRTSALTTAPGNDDATASTRGPEVFAGTPSFGPLAPRSKGWALWGVLAAGVAGPTQRLVRVDLTTGRLTLDLPPELSFVEVGRVLRAADGTVVSIGGDGGRHEVFESTEPGVVWATSIGRPTVATRRRWDPAIGDWHADETQQFAGRPVGVGPLGELLADAPDGSLVAVTSAGAVRAAESANVTWADRGRLATTTCADSGSCTTTVQRRDGSSLTLPPTTDVVWGMSVSDDDRRVVRLVGDGWVELTEADGTSRLVAGLETREFRRPQVAWAPDGTGLVVLAEGLLVLEPGKEARFVSLDGLGEQDRWIRVVGVA